LLTNTHARATNYIIYTYIYILHKNQRGFYKIRLNIQRDVDSATWNLPDFNLVTVTKECCSHSY